jgi:Sec-independent protein secretion pathway component TatC
MATGMFSTMALLMTGRAMQPSEPLFWAVMSLGVTVGFTTAYPINVWMVARNMKHGLMTRRPSDRAQRAQRAHRMRWNVTRPQLTAIAA